MTGSILDPLLGWLLNLHPAFGIIIVSFLVSLIVTLGIKVFTNQSLMKDLKNELKELQNEMKELKNNPKKLQKVNDRFMETNMKYMSHSMRPTLFTFIPIILVFGWLGANLGYYPLDVGQNHKLSVYFAEPVGEATLTVPEGMNVVNETTMTPKKSITKLVAHKEVDWLISGTYGTYTVEVEHQGQTYQKEVIISKEKYAPVEKSFQKRILFFSSLDGNIEKITLSNEKLKPFRDVPIIKDLPWISEWGWLGVYILFSIIFSMSLRKMFDIY